MRLISAVETFERVASTGNSVPRGRVGANLCHGWGGGNVPLRVMIGGIELYNFVREMLDRMVTRKEGQTIGDGESPKELGSVVIRPVCQVAPGLRRVIPPEQQAGWDKSRGCPVEFGINIGFLDFHSAGLSKVWVSTGIPCHHDGLGPFPGIRFFASPFLFAGFLAGLAFFFRIFLPWGPVSQISSASCLGMRPI